MSVFQGAAVAITTPFKEDLSVDFERFGEQIEYQIAGGTDAIVVCGTTGEASTLSHEEHLAVVKYCVEKVNHRIPVIAGTGSNCTETAVYLSKEAASYGVDGLLLVTPYYNKATQKGLYEHFKIVAEAAGIPVILYNIPGRTGCKMNPETVVALCKDVPNIVGVKDATADFSSMAKMMALADGCVDLYSGNDDQIVPILALGGKGVISVLSDVAPRQCHEICQAFFEGRINDAISLQLQAVDLCSSLFCEVNPIPVKKAMQLQGRDTGVVRRPLTEMEPQNAERLEKSMRAYGIL